MFSSSPLPLSPTSPQQCKDRSWPFSFLSPYTTPKMLNGEASTIKSSFMDLFFKNLSCYIFTYYTDTQDQLWSDILLLVSKQLLTKEWKIRLRKWFFHFIFWCCLILLTLLHVFHIVPFPHRSVYACFHFLGSLKKKSLIFLAFLRIWLRFCIKYWKD